jgi:hypothetical protein
MDYLRAGAWRVDASSSMAMVVVHGGKHLDPWTLKCYLQRLGESRPRRHGGGTRRQDISIVSDGGRPQRSHFEGIVHMGPEPEYNPYEYGYEYPYRYPYRQLPPPPPPYHRPRWF